MPKNAWRGARSVKSPPLLSEECGCPGFHYSCLLHLWVCVCVCVRVHAVTTYGPHSTRSERTLSMPRSHTFMHSLVISMERPWKFSWSKTVIWMVAGAGRRRVKYQVQVVLVWWLRFLLLCFVLCVHFTLDFMPMSDILF